MIAVASSDSVLKKGCSQMKKRFKHRVSLILFGLVCLLVLPQSVWADDTAPTTAPLNPAFVQYLADREAGTLTTSTADGYGLGYMPPPVVRVEAPVDASLDTAASFPASYDLRSLGRVTDVRHQGTYNVCWAFASLASLESTLKPTATVDLSENNLRWNHGFDSGPEDPGNADMAMAYLTRWSGPVSESSDPYGSSKKIGLAPVYHVQQAENLPKSATAIKQALMDSGAVYTSIYASSTNSSSYYNADAAALYYNGSNPTDHAVTIVGWDDNFDRSLFPLTAPGNGAWIIKNSWGPNWGDGGYFYLSYYDTHAGEAATVFNNAEATSNYGRIYQYDPLGNTGSRGYTTADGSAWGANIFTAAASENLTAIATYSMSANTTAEISIYTDVAADNPSSGQLRATQTANFAYGGYYTVALNTPVSLTANQKFAVVIKYTTPNNEYQIPTERAVANYSSSASANGGESFTRGTGSDIWYDSGYYDNESVCIKAFTGGQSVATLTGIEITSPANKLSYQIGESLDLSGLVVTGRYSDGSTRTETLTAANVSGFDTTTAGTKTLTITVGGKTTSYTITVKSAATGGVDVYYRTHIQNVGWQYDCKNGEVSGTSGYGYRLEAIQIQLVQSDYDLGIAYRTHIQNIGWAPWHYDKEISGTSGLGLRLEAIEIKLVGADADKFDVYYRVHCQNIGWMGWGKNGQMAGTSGYGYRLEAIQIEVVPKGTNFSVDANEPAYLETN
ncbi:MAG: surface layer protein B [Firmicutes bacterium HGW-Firmicutes-4]|jgi:C1A family cysteine protease|nr:MAG: surface layer protein B [Firmicutes bacterium HGW-Firmicutes-4]